MSAIVPAKITRERTLLEHPGTECDFKEGFQKQANVI